ncbi:DNase I-like protein, partial [Cryphonectria parasitica EP155]
PPPNPAQSASETTEPVDLFSSNANSLHHAVYARRAEYTRPHRIRIKVGTWNVAACPGTDKDLAAWFVDGDGASVPAATQPSDSATPSQDTEGPRILAGDKIGLYVLGLQEVVTLNPVSQYVYSDPNPTDKWRLALEAAMPKGYTFVTSEHMSGLLLLLYASTEVAPSIGNISTKVVGTGVGGWFGNKGATIARILLGEATRLVFVNSHLSSGSDPSTVERRCWDVRTIVDRTRFDPVSVPGYDNTEGEDRIGDEDFAFWFGDLNFRLGGIPGDDIRRLLTLHTTGEYGSTRRPEPSNNEDAIIVKETPESTDERAAAAAAAAEDSSARRSQSSSNPGGEDDDSVDLPDPDDFEPDPQEDPTSLQATLDSLLPHDQLQQAVKRRKIFHDGWREGPISFLPSYKYDVGTVGVFDSSEKKRAPSWCDRILFRTRLDRERFELKLREEAAAHRRDEEMKARGIDHAGDDDEVLFDYDPEHDGDTEPAGQPGLDYDEYEDAGGLAGLSAGNEDSNTADCINLETYTSYQRVTSSDHKPVAAIFTLDFAAVVPELKAEVLAEVARELDRAENEGRPSITIVVEGSQSGSGSVDVGDIRYLERRTAYLTLANTGRVPATLSFVEKPATEQPGDGGPDRQWLETSLSRTELSGVGGGEEAFDLGKEVTLEPGETVTASIQVFVGQLSQARLLNEGGASLDEVLVLRVTDGRDYFIPVRAVWLPTCMGRSVDELIRVPDGGIRRLVTSLADTKEGKQHTGAIPYSLTVHRSAPKELFKLIDALETLTDRTLADEQMLGSYTIPRDKHGWPFEDFVADPHEHLIPSVIDTLDTDRPIADAFLPETNPCQRLETVAEVLVHFLRGLTDGVVSVPLWSKIEQAPIKALGQAPPSSSGSGMSGLEAAEDDKVAILDILTTAPNHNICFVFLTTTLASVVAELAPVQKDKIETPGAGAASAASQRGAIGAIGALGRRSLSFRQSLTIGSGTTMASSVTEAIAALERRKARERRVAQIFGNAVCRAPETGRDKDRKILEGKQSTLVELFIRRR